MVDGQTDGVSIADLFINTYRDLYTSVSYDISEMDNIQNNINEMLVKVPSTADWILNMLDLNMQYHASKHIRIMVTQVSLVLSLLMMTAWCASLYLRLLQYAALLWIVPIYSTILPIPKGRDAYPLDSSSIPDIALSSIYGKLFDIIILICYADRLLSLELQFSFKANSSTNLCSVALNESLAYYASHESPVFWTCPKHLIDCNIASCSGWWLIARCRLL